MTVDRPTPADYATILEEHASFWGDRDLRPAHHPVLVHEFAHTSVALRDGDRLVAYLFGFVEQGVGYVHLVGVREGHRREGFATKLWDEFEEIARERGAHTLRAITTPANEMSIGFHTSLGMEAERVADYAGPGHDRVVFTRPLRDSRRRELDHFNVEAPQDCEVEGRRFYGELLGLEELPRPATMGRPGLWFALGGGRELHVSGYEDFAPATKAHPGLRVAPAEIDALAERLDGAGAGVRWDERLADRRRFYTNDPWGNRLEVLAL